MPDQVQLDARVTIKGVVLPTWLAILGICTLFFTSMGSCALLWRAHEAESREVLRSKAVERELRLLALHIQDVENVLIRSKLAGRQDFAAWEPAPAAESQKE